MAKADSQHTEIATSNVDVPQLPVSSRNINIPPQTIVLQLPIEITLQVLSYLDYVDVTKCTGVCKAWKDLSRDSALWKVLYLRHFYLDVWTKYLYSNVWEVAGKAQWYQTFLQAQKIHKHWQNKQIKYSTLKLLPKKRAYACAGFDSKGRIYVLGGWDDTNKCNKEMMLQVYDTHTMRYSVPDLTSGTAPNCRAGMTCISLPHVNQLMFFGGQHIAKLPQKIYNDVFILDTEKLVWRKPETRGTSPSHRAWATAELIGNKVYVFGGGGFDSNWKEACLFNDLHVLDLKTMEWSAPETFGTPPCPRAGHTSSVLSGDTIIIHAGGNLGGSQVFGDTFVLNIKTMEWKKLDVCGDVPGPMGSLNSCVVGKAFYSFGGWHGTVDGVDQGSVSTLYTLNTTTLKWNVIKPWGDLELVCRSGSAACFCAGKWYVFGGINNTNRIIADVVVFELETITEAKQRRCRTKDKDKSVRG